MSDESKTTEPLIERLFHIGAHFGFSKSRRHPSATPYIFGIKNRVEIIDLEQTQKMLESAKEYVCKLAAENKSILFVSGKNEARSAIRRGAEALDMPYVAGRFVGGTLTNYSQMKKRIDRLAQLRKERDAGELSKYTKKERLMIDREIDRLEHIFGGIAEMDALPAALFVVDPRAERIAIEEALKLNIPIVALASSDCNLDEIDYPILANDTSITSITFFINEIVDAYQKSRTAKKEGEPAVCPVE